MTGCLEVTPLLGPLLDGALADDNREWVMDHLEACASCRERKALMAAQGQAIREVIGARAAQADLARFADRVMARVAADTSRDLSGRLRVWASETWGAHRGAFAAMASLAAAACLALVVFAPGPAPKPPLYADASGPQVEEVEFGTHDGAVLQLPRETTVIWMSEDKAVEE